MASSGWASAGLNESDYTGLVALRRLLHAVPFVRRAFQAVTRKSFQRSDTYWEERYRLGGNSGAGSYGGLARYKADFVNEFMLAHNLTRVIEFGCGDGAQLALAEYPEYVGFDVAPGAIDRCLNRFAEDRSKSFFLYSPRHFRDPLGAVSGDIALSLDVVYHLVEDYTFDVYMGHLFQSARSYVVVYSSNDCRASDVPWIRHRRYTDWVERRCPQWELIQHERNPYGSNDIFAEFRVFGRRHAHE
jgi:SAM-dependent methyltransferase